VDDVLGLVVVETDRIRVSRALMFLSKAVSVVEVSGETVPSCADGAGSLRSGNAP
jgi:hypothetical protein